MSIFKESENLFITWPQFFGILAVVGLIILVSTYFP